jgi:hypothetical protein
MIHTDEHNTETALLRGNKTYLRVEWRRGEELIGCTFETVRLSIASTTTVKGDILLLSTMEVVSIKCEGRQLKHLKW